MINELYDFYEGIINSTKKQWLCLEQEKEYYPQEFIIQILWNEQLFNSPLYLIDQRELKIASLGTWNLEAGPDFLNAHICINGEWIKGDIEIHRYAHNWYDHNHDNDKRYDNVILHVIWNEEEIKQNKLPNIPTLSLSNFLPQNWRSIIDYKTPEHYTYGQQITSGKCSELWTSLSDTEANRLLFHAGKHRLIKKSERLSLINKSASMNQALYQLIAEAIGYKNNKEAFLELACFCDLGSLHQCSNNNQKLALLLGASRLLPDPSTNIVNNEIKEDILELWQYWWQNGSQMTSIKFSFLGRPLNSPERRVIGLWSFLCIIDWDPNTYLLTLANNCNSLKIFHQEFSKLFTNENKWNSWHNFKTKLKNPSQLIGKSRINDIFINVITPWLIINKEQINWDIFPQPYPLSKLQDNRVIKEASHRFFYPPSRANNILTCPITQQGIMNIYKNICVVNATNCENCHFIKKTQEPPIQNNK